MSQAPAQVKMSESGALGDSIPNCNTAILAVTSCNAAMRLVELVELDVLCFFSVASCQFSSGILWDIFRHRVSRSWRMWLSKSLSSFKVREEDTYLDDLCKRNLLVSRKWQRDAKSYKAGVGSPFPRNRDYALLLLDSAWSCIFHFWKSALCKGISSDILRCWFGQMAESNLDAQAPVKALAIETFSRSSQECTLIPFASSVSASRTPWKEHRARGLQMSTALIALVKMPHAVIVQWLWDAGLAFPSPLHWQNVSRQSVRNNIRRPEQDLVHQSEFINYL